MRNAALDVIRDEHQALAAMLRSLKLLLAQARRENTLPDFAVLRAMLLYVDEFPERLHHPKESELLFPRLLKRAPELATTLARLDNDHARGEAAIRDVEHALLAFEVMGEPRRAAFEQAVDRYVAAYLEHMAVEESEILPAAQRLLTAQDWLELDAAFAANRDPLTGHEPADEYRELFHTIVHDAPAPIGLGGGAGASAGRARR
jgi:hemerythrin-like domain-containing protein